MSEAPGYGDLFHAERGPAFDLEPAAVLPHETGLKMYDRPQYDNYSSPGIFDPSLTAVCRYPCNQPGHFHPENGQTFNYGSWFPNEEELDAGPAVDLG